MQIAAVRITLYAPESRSLKDKRRIVRSILDQVRHRFNVSAAEVDAMDLHQRIVMGIACVSNERSHVQQEIDSVIRFIEEQAESLGADVLSVEDV